MKEQMKNEEKCKGKGRKLRLKKNHKKYREKSRRDLEETTDRKKEKEK